MDSRLVIALLCLAVSTATKKSRSLDIEPACTISSCAQSWVDMYKTLYELKSNFENYRERSEEEIEVLIETVKELKKEVKMLSPPGAINNPAKSCKEIFQEDRTSVNGLYYLKSNTPEKKSVAYCHMASIPGCGSGGWTLLMKTDGTKKTFHYNSAFWTNKLSYRTDGARFGLSKEETKLSTYWSTPFTKLCLGMEVNNDLRWTTLTYSGSSLYDVIVDGSFKSTNMGRSGWKSLIRGSSMQANCNREGFNIDTSMKVRIGFVGNNEKDCLTNDSRIGFGAGGGPGCATADDSNTCGNNAGCGTDKGDKNIKAFGYILVQ